MIEPRVDKDLLTKAGLIFIGGTELFDLWHNPSIAYPLRVQALFPSSSYKWDNFKVPLVNNHTRNFTVMGLFRALCLTTKDVETIEIYLRCFAPWVLGTNLTEENNNE